MLRLTPRKRQTLLFSATMTEEVRDLASLSLQRPVRLAADAAGAAPKTLQQEIIRLKVTPQGSLPFMPRALLEDCLLLEYIDLYKQLALGLICLRGSLFARKKRSARSSLINLTRVTEVPLQGSMQLHGPSFSKALSGSTQALCDYTRAVLASHIRRRFTGRLPASQRSLKVCMGSRPGKQPVRFRGLPECSPCC